MIAVTCHLLAVSSLGRMAEGALCFIRALILFMRPLTTGPDLAQTLLPIVFLWVIIFQQLNFEEIEDFML